MRVRGVESSVCWLQLAGAARRFLVTRGSANVHGGGLPHQLGGLAVCSVARWRGNVFMERIPWKMRQELVVTKLVAKMPAIHLSIKP